MLQNPNDALWDPRPRLARETEHVGGQGGASPNPDSVLVELAGGPGMTSVAAVDVARSLEGRGFTLDQEYGAIPFGASAAQQTFVVRGRLSDDRVVPQLEQDPRVVKVWRDTPVAPF